MKLKSLAPFARFAGPVAGSVACGLVPLILFAPAGFAASQYFSDAGGPLNWDAATTADWGAALGGPYSSVWTSGNTAIFEGTAGTVNVSGTAIPTCGGMTFNTTGYILSGGTIKCTNNSTLTIATAGQSATINSVLADASGASAIKFSGPSYTASITLGSSNTFTGIATIQSVSVAFSNLANGGTASSFGAGANTVAVVVGGNSSAAFATYTGSGGSTDRPWLVGGSSAGSNANINNNGSGPISFNNTGSAIGAAGGTGPRNLTLGGSYTGGANTFAGQLSNMSGYTTSLKVGGSIWTITRANTHTGGTTLAGGTLRLGNPGALGSGPLTITGGALDSSVADLVNSQTNAQNWNGDFSFTGTQNLDLGTGPVTLSTSRKVTVNASTLTVGGAIAGSGFGLTKAGAGTLVLSGASTYTGTTLISGGTLLVNGSLGSGAVTNSAGGFLGGNGMIGGNVTFAAGACATNNPGSVLAIGGSLVLNNNSFYLATPYPLPVGEYPLMTYSSPGSSGAFNPAPVLSGAGLAANTAGTIVTEGGTVLLRVAATAASTTIGFTCSGNGAVVSFGGTNGQPYRVLTSTDAAAALTNWTTVASGTLTEGVVSYYTNSSPAEPRRFYIISSP